MKVPFIDLQPYIDLVRSGHHDRVGAPFDEDVAYLLNTREFIGGGPTTLKLEAALSKRLGSPNVVTCANGTDALVLALRAAGIDRGSRVAIPNLTFWATYEAVVAVGATPVLLDIDREDLQLCFDEFMRAHNTRHFDAAILVHLYGWCSKRLLDFREFCRARRITLIEDGAQAFGVNYAGESVFADADIATLSFHPAKVLGGIGDGGAVLCKSARTAARVRLLANHGRIGHYQHIVAGWNSRMDAIQAAWLLRALVVIDKVIEERRRVVRELAPEPPYNTYVVPPMNCDDNGYLQVMVVDDPDATQRRLHELGIEAGRVYPCTIADQEGARSTITIGSLHMSREIAGHIINLPLFYGITDEQVAYVLEKMK